MKRSKLMRFTDAACHLFAFGLIAWGILSDDLLLVVVGFGNLWIMSTARDRPRGNDLDRLAGRIVELHRLSGLDDVDVKYGVSGDEWVMRVSKVKKP